MWSTRGACVDHLHINPSVTRDNAVSDPALRGALELIPYLTGEGGQGIGVENLLLISERATPVDIFEHQAAPATGGRVPRDDMKVDLGIDIHEECVVQLVRAEQRCERAHQSA